MQQASFAHIHGSSSAGARPDARGEKCAAMPRGEVRPYAPFGLMHLPRSVDVKAVDAGGRGGDVEQEQRGRTGLAA